LKSCCISWSTITPLLNFSAKAGWLSPKKVYLS
jgi:hypothetical protein